MLNWYFRENVLGAERRKVTHFDLGKGVFRSDSMKTLIELSLRDG